jgi:nitrogenase iron protein NifH
MKKIAIYGKGGIGKSTVTSTLSACLADMGKKVMQIGCDPKADSTFNLLEGRHVDSVMDVLLANDGICPNLASIACEGYKGVVCVEAGGPTPGSGCAGRGIVKTFDTLEEFDAFEVYKPDYVLFDVLGDVVCGGFATPMRAGFADEVVIVTSGEKMSLYAADNIKRALDSFASRGYAKLRGLILNRRGIADEEQIVADFAQRIGTQVIGTVPRDGAIQQAEAQGMTVQQMNPQLEVSQTFMQIARTLLNEGEAR